MGYKTIQLIKTETTNIDVAERHTHIVQFNANRIGNSGLVALGAEDDVTNLEIHQNNIEIKRYVLNNKEVFIAKDGGANEILHEALQSSEYYRSCYNSASRQLDNLRVDFSMWRDKHYHLQRKYMRDVTFIRKAGFIERLKYLFCGFPLAK